MTVTAASPSTRSGSDRDPMTRLERLFDPGSLIVLPGPDESRVTVASGRIGNDPVIAFCNDATRMGGAIGMRECLQIADATDLGTREGWPVVGLWHSGGAMLSEGVEAMDGVGRIFAAMVRASGRVPQISVVLGPAAGGAAYGPALTDIVVMAPEGRVFVTGPDVVRQVTGESVDMESLGGPEAHGRKSGVAHVIADSERDAIDRARRLTSLLSRQGKVEVGSAVGGTDVADLFPETTRRAYDVRPVVRHILDRDPEGHEFEELQATWAPNIVVGLGRLGGRTVGVIANNPLRKGGCLDSLSAEKASRFVRMCDSLGVPLVVLVDVPGYLPGVKQEWEGVVRRGAKLLHAFAEASVPRITLVTRKSYGGAYIAMNSRSLGATAVLAWPGAEVAIMGAEAAVGVLHRKRLAAAADSEREELRRQLVEAHEREEGGVQRGLAIGVVDEVIDPADTRRRIAELLAAAPPTRGQHANIPL